jgi:hypothetical protein
VLPYRMVEKPNRSTGHRAVSPWYDQPHFKFPLRNVLAK